MASKFQTLIFTLISFFFLLPTSLSDSDAISWCDRTPFPRPCKHFLAHNPNHNSLHDVRKFTIKLALDYAVRASAIAKTLGSKCRTARQKAALTDCLDLYQTTIDQLNKTIDPNAKCTNFDSKTWLSAALTNVDTCMTGFAELDQGRVPDFIQPLVSNNASRLICNSLSLVGDNETGHESASYYGAGGFPTWVSPGDRRLLQVSVGGIRANAVVALDGSGNFRRIKDAIAAAARRSGGGRFVIYVKRGVYRENLEITGSKLRNVMLVGDGIRYTFITGSRSVGGGSTTFNSATVAVTSDGFIASGITFRNTAGPQNHQAVALRSGADLSVFYRCGFEGYQDTLYLHSQRQFYKECYIYGTVDFIFGNAAAVLQNCMIYGRRPMSGQKITVTAQGRTDPNQNTGISIHNSRIAAAPDLSPVVGSFPAYLGRPWKQYSRTVVMESYIDSLVVPAGWLQWDGDFALNTLYYGEYRNTGPGSGTGRRVRWRGYRVITDPAEARRFTVESFIGGRSWLPAAGVPFTAGL